MSISKIELLCLNAIADDYESLSLIIREIKNLGEHNLQEEEIRRCLVRLAGASLLEVFEYVETSHIYKKSSLLDGNWDKKWFLITRKGRELLEKG